MTATDAEYEDKAIEKVSTDADGTYTITCDGWSLWCGKECPVKPKKGQAARLYGKGIGYPVRGLFIDGVQVWYRTPDEQKDHAEKELYGEDAREWLRRWDEGRPVWSIEMGGLGPGYEQCIQIMAAEKLRWLLNWQTMMTAAGKKLDWEDDKQRKKAFDKLDKQVMEVPVVKNLGCSGAQWGASTNLAACLFRMGPRGVMNDERVKDRKIQVCRVFPGG